MSAKRAAIIVLDGVGIGAAPDAAEYGDADSDTLGNVARECGGLKLPRLERLGLGNISPLQGVPPRGDAAGAWGKMRPASAGKDSTTGHWEIAGVHLARPFPTYPAGFPEDVIDAFARATGRGVIGNVVGSGTEVIERYADEQKATGSWIVYTSADSVFQIAADEAVIPLPELYKGCEVAREMLAPPHNVSRVIARPFVTENGVHTRTANRRDYSLPPPSETLLDALAEAGIQRDGVGKVDDLFAGRSIGSQHTASNAEGIHDIKAWLSSAESGFLFANLVDFDQLYGHRNDVAGFYDALREFDGALRSITSRLKEDDLLFITADHGNDPTTPSTDHAREFVPLLATGMRVVPRDLGERSTFSDLGATVAEWFGLSFRGRGTSFLAELIV
ncbi:MAG TPA: phosphopentomutase [Gemmatimonadaceae bacterium]|jgi:phosphopentomutase|nr:phosphopentomutase [Gemmatimonadaceae bacterium]